MAQQTHLHSVQHDARFTASVDETTDNGPAAPPPSGGGTEDRGARAASKARSGEPLPTDRLKFDNQLAVLRNVAISSGNNRRGSSAEDMSAALGLNGGTGGLNSRFFRAAGWFEAVGRGAYTASPGLLAWNTHIGIDPDGQYDAAAKMRDEVRASWFWQTLEPMLASGQPINTKLAILELAKSSGASSHQAQLDTILDWLSWVGLIDRVSDQIQLRADHIAQNSHAALPTEDSGLGDTEDPRDDAEDPLDAAPGEKMGQPAATGDMDAIVSFNLSVRLTADDMRALDGDQRDFILSLAERLRG